MQTDPDAQLSVRLVSDFEGQDGAEDVESHVRDLDGVVCTHVGNSSHNHVRVSNSLNLQDFELQIKIGKKCKVSKESEGCDVPDTKFERTDW